MDGECLEPGLPIRLHHNTLPLIHRLCSSCAYTDMQRSFEDKLVSKMFSIYSHAVGWKVTYFTSAWVISNKLVFWGTFLELVSNVVTTGCIFKCSTNTILTKYMQWFSILLKCIYIMHCLHVHWPVFVPCILENAVIYEHCKWKSIKIQNNLVVSLSDTFTTMDIHKGYTMSYFDHCEYVIWLSYSFIYTSLHNIFVNHYSKKTRTIS